MNGSTEVVPCGCTSRQAHLGSLTVWSVCGPTVSCRPRLQVATQFRIRFTPYPRKKSKLSLVVWSCPQTATSVVELTCVVGHFLACAHECLGEFFVRGQRNGRSSLALCFCPQTPTSATVEMVKAEHNSVVSATQFL